MRIHFWWDREEKKPVGFQPTTSLPWGMCSTTEPQLLPTANLNNEPVEIIELTLQKIVASTFSTLIHFEGRRVKTILAFHHFLTVDTRAVARRQFFWRQADRFAKYFCNSNDLIRQNWTLDKFFVRCDRKARCRTDHYLSVRWYLLYYRCEHFSICQTVYYWSLRCQIQAFISNSDAN